MAGSAAFGAEPNPEVFSWLKSLPSAPEYHPTLAEFQDPISYIFKIEKEASKYGICKIVPPVPPSPKKTIITNLNRSLAARAASFDSKSQPTFTTRQQQIGFCPRKLRPVKRPVWQSGEYYTFQEFEAKAKAFEKSYLRKCTKKGGLSPLEIETLYWKATVDKPFSVEYANDMPGSAFIPVRDKRCREAGEGVSLGETAWNMRAVSRANGSLLRFMKEEIPGVTSPMVYIAMMFSWFAWHVEDHDLHSLNYLHTGAGKTWYGVPSDAAFAFEEVVRVHGYGEEINPLVTFAVLGEKTTVMSPEVLIGAGVPCCRLVQNAGEFVVTFPRAYHTGFSHGLNCGEAANIATPEWLMFAKNAAIRRASVNYPPMLSHFQLLYDLALALCSRIPVAINIEPRSSRLKDKRKSEGDMVVKELFVQNVVQNNKLLHVLGKGSSVVILPRNSSGISVCSKLRFGSQLNPDHSSGLCSLTAGRNASKPFVSDDLKDETEQVSSFFSVKGKFLSLCERNRNFSSPAADSIHISNYNTRNLDCKSEMSQGDRISDQRLFSCVTCGVISFACVAILQPREPASRYLMSADCSFFNDWIVGSGVTSKKFGALNEDAFAIEQNNFRGWMEKNVPDALYNRPVQPIDKLCQVEDQSYHMTSNTETRRESSALGLLASAYGNSSDSEEDLGEPNAFVDSSGQSCPSGSWSQHKISCGLSLRKCHDTPIRMHDRLSQLDDKGGICPKVAGNDTDYGYRRSNSMDESDQILQLNDMISVESDGSGEGLRNSRGRMSFFPPNRLCDMGKPAVHDAVLLLDKKSTRYASPSDEDSSRMHVFCLEHAAEVEMQLRPIGGVHILLLCHPDFPKIEAEAKFVAGELGMQYLWNDISYKHATLDDEERIQSALDGEEADLGNGDWAAKLGINLFYSAVLSRSPLYSKQMPYNSVIYDAFGRGTPPSSPMDSKPCRKRAGKQKKVVAGNWCGKVWMSYQVHPLLGKNCEYNYVNDDISSHGWTSPDQKPERRSVSTQKVETVRKYSRKRKPASENASDSIDQCIDREDQFSGISMEDESCDNATEDYSELPLRRRILCSKPVKSETLRQMKQKPVPAKKQTSRPVKSGAQKLMKPKTSRQMKQPPQVRNNKVRNTEQFISSDEEEEEGGPSTQTSRPVKPGTQKLMKPKTSQQMKQPPQVRNNKVRNTEQFISSDEEEEEGGPSTRLRKRVPKVAKSEIKMKEKQRNSRKKARTGSSVKRIDSLHESDTNDLEADFQCDIEGCTMSFGTKQELLLHKKNVCPVKDCGKKFFSHKYLVQHRRVHLDDRPLRCPWKGCKMSFKWAWARTEHIRVHTGARPYVCGEPGCGQTFRFVSDFSRHKRRTGHSAKKNR